MKKNHFLREFKGKKILISGHTGLKGSWLSLWLNYLGAKVYGISNNFKTNQTNFKNFKMKKNIKNFDIDIRDFKILNKVQHVCMILKKKWAGFCSKNRVFSTSSARDIAEILFI